MLKNRAYIGEYRHGDVTVESSIPLLVDEDMFQRAKNKRLGRYARSEDTAEAPSYKLVGKLYRGEYVRTLQGVLRTSATRQK